VRHSVSARRSVLRRSTASRGVKSRASGGTSATSSAASRRQQTREGCASDMRPAAICTARRGAAHCGVSITTVFSAWLTYYAFVAFAWRRSFVCVRRNKPATTNRACISAYLRTSGVLLLDAHDTNIRLVRMRIRGCRVWKYARAGDALRGPQWRMSLSLCDRRMHLGGAGARFITADSSLTLAQKNAPASGVFICAFSRLGGRPFFRNKGGLSARF